MVLYRDKRKTDLTNLKNNTPIYIMTDIFINKL